MALRRLGYRNAALSRGITQSKPRQPLQERFRNHVLDRWQMETLANFPGLFSQLLLCLETVDNEDRQREILLNYWRSRISLYLDAKADNSRPFCVVDEGLSQSMFSTMTRMLAPSNRKLGLVESALRCLPPDRSVIMLQTPLNLIEMRTKSSPRFSSDNLSRKFEEVEFILESQKKLGRDIFELDGSLSVEELGSQIQAHIDRPKY